MVWYDVSWSLLAAGDSFRFTWRHLMPTLATDCHDYGNESLFAANSPFRCISVVGTMKLHFQTPFEG